MSIEAIGIAIPPIVHTAADIAAVTGAEEKFIIEKVGIEKRHILAEGQTGVSLSAEACANLFAKSALTPDDVDLLVYVTQNHDRRVPQNSAQLAHAIGLPKSVAALDIYLGCSGYIYSLATVYSLLDALGLENALLVTCDPYSRELLATDKASNAVFGDGATATWIKKSGTRNSLGKFDFGTDGSGGDAIQIPKGGAADPYVSLLRIDDEVDVDRTRVHMSGRDVFNFVLSTVPGSFDNCLARNDLDKDQIDLFLLHQGSKHMLLQLGRRYGIPVEKMPFNIQKYGNTGPSTIPLLLQEVLDDPDCEAKTLLLSGFGVGLSWGTTILRIN